jgi:hypothetical protein
MKVLDERVTEIRAKSGVIRRKIEQLSEDEFVSKYVKEYFLVGQPRRMTLEDGGRSKVLTRGGGNIGDMRQILRDIANNKYDNADVDAAIFQVQNWPGANVFEQMICIGRAHVMDILLDDRRGVVSNWHASLEMVDGMWNLKDRDSAHGTRMHRHTEMGPILVECVNETPEYLTSKSTLYLADYAPLRFYDAQDLWRSEHKR